ncbi:MAG: ABC transporter permease [Chitinophagaceae bacterium]|nr:ABC transporter permease [Chitinophagaceae bacterium]MCW5914827.1 ABC transporter permease [Chitinophagaceae bacterium]MCZ2396169.1 ABC transporter permease [Chitinophagales bacterium]
MFKNYFKIAFRNLWKNKGFTFINIAGLAIGLSCFILIALYVTNELDYDRFYPNAERIYRVDADIKFGGNLLNLTVSSDPMGPTLKKDYPQVEDYTRIYASEGSKIVRKGNDYFNEEKIVYADSTFFNLFPQTVLSGETKTALFEPNTVVISETAAKKYFSTTNASGKTIEIDQKPFKVTAVIKDMPRNSHFHFDFIMSMKNVDYQWNSFLSHNFHTYILLRPGTDYHAFEKNFTQVLEQHVFPQASQLISGLTSMDEFRKAGNMLNYSLMPLTKIHLYSQRYPELEANGNIQYVYIFSAVALFILLIACINFMNLSTARSVSRAKEVGIRKVLGTRRKSLISQFLSESTLMALISLILAIVITYFVLPGFNDIAAKSMSIRDIFNPTLLPFLIALPFIVGLLAGLYPAFFLSKFKPVSVLKGRTNAGFKKNILRSGLVVFQFFTSIVLIIGTIIIYKQLHFIQTTSLGFNKNQVLIVDGAWALNKNDEAFKNEVLKLPGVESATMSGYIPVNSSRSDNTYSRDATMNQKNALSMQTWKVDYDYIGTMGMQIIKGRNFSKDFGTDSSAVILNEAAVRVLGFDNPVGNKIYQNFPGGAGSVMKVYNIIGVVKDFHFESLRHNIYPLGLILEHNNTIMSFRINTADVKPLIAQIKNKWTALAPGMPFSYRFMDEAFNNIYRSEQQVGKISITFAILAIFIACLGLFGLVTYMAEQRTKEIGIRKVLGASVGQVTGMLSRDFLKLVLIASLIAFPVAWWVMHRWLQDFAYRIKIDWWVFLIAGLIALLIALATVSFQAIKAAMANPAKSLRTE